MPATVTTKWTGLAGNGLWNDAGNWTDGVPPSGADATSDGQDVAIIDNSVETAPFTVLITGSQGGQDVTLDAADPAGGSAVSLTGSLDLEYNGGTLGTLNLSAGTFAIDGGELSVANVDLDGGTLAFGAAAAYGSSTLNADIIDGSLTVGNDSQVAIAQNSFDNAGDSPGDVLTVQSGSDLLVQGSLGLEGTLDVQSGGTLTLDGGGIVQNGNASAVVVIEPGATVADSGDFTFGGAVTIEGGFSVGSGHTVRVDSGQAVFQANAGGAAETVVVAGGGTLAVQDTLDLSGTLSGAGIVQIGSAGIVSGGTIATNGIQVVDSGAFAGVTVDTSIVVDGGILGIGGGVTTVGSDAGPAQTIDLGGGALVVAGTLDLANTVLENGTVQVLDGGVLNLDADSSESAVTAGVAPGSTDWTGAAGDGLWSDSGNWTAGLPQMGSGASAPGQDVATIDNSIDATPFTVAITGSQVAQNVLLDSADPAGAPSVLLTGSLDLGYGSAGGSLQPGGLTLLGGTFEVDGGTLGDAGVTISGGTLAFGADGTDTLSAVTVEGSFAAAPDSTLVVSGGASTFEGVPGGGAEMVSLGTGATLVVSSATLTLAGTIAGGTMVVSDGTLDGGSLRAGAFTVQDGGTVSGTTLDESVTVSAGFGGGRLIDSGGVIGDAGDTQPVTVDLGGGVLEVAGALALDDATVTDGSIVLDPGAKLALDGDSSDSAVPVYSTVSTTWTGSAGDGLWSDPGNWTDGVPQPAGPYSSSSQDTATITNGVDTAPFAVVVAGSQGVAALTVDAADPAGGPAVELTGSLGMEFDVTGGSGQFGVLTLSSGSFQVDGGTLSVASVVQEGGHLTFGAGQDTLNADLVQGAVDVAAGATLVTAQNSFDDVNSAPGTSTPVTLTVEGTLDNKGSLSVNGTVDLRGGTFVLDGGGVGGDANPAVIDVDTGSLVDSGNANFTNVEIEGLLAVGAGQVVSVASGTTTTLTGAAGAPAADTIGSGGTIEVLGTLGLSGAVETGAGLVELISGGTISGGTISGNDANDTLGVSGSGTLMDTTVLGVIAAGGGTLTTLGTVVVGSDAGPRSTLDLGGGTLVVSGTLDLFDTVLQNGTVDLDGGTLDLDAESYENNITTSSGGTTTTPVDTGWTGAAADGNWANPANWTDGVPPAGLPYAQASDDVATIDTAPQTIVIGGSQGGADVILDAADPAVGPAVELTGTLDLAFNGTGGGATLGVLTLQSGTFELDGGTFSVGTIQQEGGTVAFGPGTESTLNAAGFDGSFTLGSATLVAARDSFADVNSPDGTSGPSTVTVAPGGELDVQGSLGVDGAIDLAGGTLLLDGGTLAGNNGPVTVTAENGGTVALAGTTGLNDADFETALAIPGGDGIVVSSGATTVLAGGGSVGSGGTVTVYGTLVGGALDLAGTLMLDAGTPVVADAAAATGTGSTPGAAVLSGTTVTGAGSVVVAGGATLIDDGIDASFTQDGGAVVTTVSGIVVLGDPADVTPAMVNLGGGELDVFGTLDLDDAEVTDGTIKVEPGGVLDVDSRTTLSGVQTEQSTASGLVISGQDVTLMSGTYAVTPTESLVIETGIGPGGTPSGSAGTFFIDAGATISGAGTVAVTDANGPSTTDDLDNEGGFIANVPGEALQLQTDTLTGYGLYTAGNGGTLLLGNGSGTSGVVSGGVLFSTYDVLSGSEIVVDGGVVSSIAGNVTLSGGGSEFGSVSGGSVAGLEQTLTNIGDTYPYLGELQVLGGRDFDAAHALSLTGNLVVGGGTVTAPSITGQINDEIPEITGFGTIEANLTSTLYVQASGGTLNVAGTVGSYVQLVALEDATLVYGGNLNANDDLRMRASGTVEFGGQLNGAPVYYDNSLDESSISSGGATLVLDDPLGQTIVVNGAALVGDSIDLVGVMPASGSAGLAFVRPTLSTIEIVLTTAEGGQVVISGGEALASAGYGYATDSSGSGTLITFGGGSEDAMPVVTPGPNEGIDTSDDHDDDVTSAFRFTSTGRVSTDAGATISDALVIYNTMDGNPGQGSLGGSVAGTTGDVSATGKLDGVAPGDNSNDITVSLPDTDTGLVQGVVTLDFDSTDSSGRVTPLPEQTVSIAANIYALAKAEFPKTTFYVSPAGQNTQTLNLPVMDLDLTGRGLTESLRASVAADQTDLGELVGAFGSSGLITEGSTDTSSLSFTVNSNPDDFEDGRDAVQTGTIDVDVVSDGTGTDNATPNVDEGITAVPITVDFVQLAEPDIADPQVFYAHASTTPATQTFALTVANANEDGLPPGAEEALVATLAGTTADEGSTIAFTNANATTGDIAPDTANTTSLSFTVDTDVNDIDGGYAGTQGASATLDLISDGTSTGGVGTTPLPSQTVDIEVDFVQLAKADFPVTEFVTHETPPDTTATTLTLPVDNVLNEAESPQDNLQATVTAVTGDFSPSAHPALTDPTGNTTTVSAGDTGGIGFQVETAAGQVGPGTVQTGDFTFSLTSVPTQSGFGSTPLPAQTVPVEVIVYDYADPVIDGVADPVTNLNEPGGGDVTATIDLGSIEAGATGEHDVVYTNVQTSSDQDDLSVGGSDLIAPGESVDGDTLYYGSDTLGENDETVTYDPSSVDDTSDTALTPVTITYEYYVYQPVVPAQAHGDVHLLTYDNHAFDFQAEGEFVLTRSTLAGNPFEIDVRLLPINGSSVTYIQQAGIRIGADVLNFDPTRSGVVDLNGAASTLSANDAILTLAAGQVILVGNVYHITLDTGEVVTVTQNGSGPGGFLDVAVTLGPNDANNVLGLLGPANSGSNDFELSNGTFLTPNASSGFNESDILGSFGNSWRIAAGTQSPLLSYAAGQDTDTFTNLDFPNSQATLSSLPQDVVAAAQQAVAAAGITDPTLAAEAELDYALTGSQTVLSSAQGTQQQSSAPAMTAVTQDAPPPPGVGIAAAEPSETEAAAGSTAVDFTVYLTGTSSSTVTAGYAVTAPDGTYLGAAAFGGTLPSGTMSFAPGQTSTTVTIQVPQGALGTAPTGNLQVSLTDTGSDAVVAGTAQTTLVNALPEPGPAPAPVLTALSGAGSGSGSTVALGSFVKGESAGALQFQISNTATAPADSIAGTVTDAGSSGFSLNLNQHTGTDVIDTTAAGASNTGIFLAENTATPGGFTDTVTYVPSDVNASGYSAALPTQSVTVTDTVVAASVPELLTTGPIAVGNVHVGDAPGAALVVANTAAAGAAGLDATPVVVTGGLATSGTVAALAPGQTDSTSLKVGVNTANVGPESGLVEVSFASDAGSGHTLAAGTSAQLQVTGTVYRLADPVVTGPAPSVVHVGDTVSGTLTVANADPADGYSEGLLATAAGSGAHFSASGSTGLIAAASADGTDVTYGVDTSQSGQVNGTVTLTLTSDGAGTSGLANTALPQQQVGVSVTVDNYAVAALQQVSGAATLTQSGNAYTLDFGQLYPGSGSYSDEVEALNAASGLADLLSGDYTVTGGSGFTLTGFGAFSGLGAGQAASPSQVGIDSTTRGAYQETLELDPTGGNASGYSAALSPLTLTLEADVACYAAGTRLATAGGEVPVESLSIGDRLVTASGALRRIAWIGHRGYAGRFLAANPDLQPVRFRSLSLGGGLPRRDLLVSPEHSMLLGSVLVPARLLVNGTTIRRERGRNQVDYYHVELDGHDVILAEGAPSESFVDDDSRGVFHNAAEWARLYPGRERVPPVFCAPKVESGQELEMIRRRLDDVASEVAQAA